MKYSKITVKGNEKSLKYFEKMFEGNDNGENNFTFKEATLLKDIKSKELSKNTLVIYSTGDFDYANTPLFSKDYITLMCDKLLKNEQLKFNIKEHKKVYEAIANEAEFLKRMSFKDFKKRVKGELNKKELKLFYSTINPETPKTLFDKLRIFVLNKKQYPSIEDLLNDTLNLVNGSSYHPFVETLSKMWDLEISIVSAENNFSHCSFSKSKDGFKSGSFVNCESWRPKSNAEIKRFLDEVDNDK